MEVSSSGRVVWQLRLPTDPTQSGIALQPLVLGGTGVFAEGNAVYALRLSDGHQLWRKVFPKSSDFFASAVYGLWQWRGTVIVLVGQVSSAARLVSLNAATGAVRWTLPLSRQGVTGSLALTDDGGLAMIRGYGTLSVADLTTGRLRWSRTAGHSLGPLAVGGVVIVGAEGNGGSAGSVMGYNARTGKLLWTRHGMPDQPEPQLAPGHVVFYANSQSVSALSPATGQTLWQVGTAGPLHTLSAGPSGIAVSTANPDRLYLIDPVTGRVRWRIPFTGSQAPLDTGTDILYAPAAAGSRQGFVDLRAANGSVRWAVPAPATASGLVLRFGAYAVTVGGAIRPGTPGLLSAFRLSTGKAAWTVKVPTMIQVPPAVAGADLLVQPTDPVMACPAGGALSAVGRAA
jgi:outer membrane protein assembly factor BamB